MIKIKIVLLSTFLFNDFIEVNFEAINKLQWKPNMTGMQSQETKTFSGQVASTNIPEPLKWWSEASIAEGHFTESGELVLWVLMPGLARERTSVWKADLASSTEDWRYQGGKLWGLRHIHHFILNISTVLKCFNA